MGPQGSAYWRRVFYSECLDKKKHLKRNPKRNHPKRAKKVKIQQWIKLKWIGSYKTRSNTYKLSSNRNTKNVSKRWKHAVAEGAFPECGLPSSYDSRDRAAHWPVYHASGEKKEGRGTWNLKLLEGLLGSLLGRSRVKLTGLPVQTIVRWIHLFSLLTYLLRLTLHTTNRHRQSKFTVIITKLH